MAHHLLGNWVLSLLWTWAALQNCADANSSHSCGAPAYLGIALISDFFFPTASLKFLQNPISSQRSSMTSFRACTLNCSPEGDLARYIALHWKRMLGHRKGRAWQRCQACRPHSLAQDHRHRRSGAGIDFCSSLTHEPGPCLFCSMGVSSVKERVYLINTIEHLLCIRHYSKDYTSIDSFYT